MYLLTSSQIQSEIVVNVKIASFGSQMKIVNSIIRLIDVVTPKSTSTVKAAHALTRKPATTTLAISTLTAIRLALSCAVPSDSQVST